MDLGREAAAARISAATASVSAAAASVSAATGCNVGGEPGKGVKTKGNKWRREGMKVGNRKFCCIGAGAGVGGENPRWRGATKET